MIMTIKKKRAAQRLAFFIVTTITSLCIQILCKEQAFDVYKIILLKNEMIIKECLID